MSAPVMIEIDVDEACELLQVAPFVDEAGLKKAYRRAALKSHPDKGGDTELFQRVSAAFATLESAIALDAGEGAAEDAVAPPSAPAAAASAETPASESCSSSSSDVEDDDDITYFDYETDNAAAAFIRMFDGIVSERSAAAVPSSSWLGDAVAQSASDVAASAVVSELCELWNSGGVAPPAAAESKDVEMQELGAAIRRRLSRSASSAAVAWCDAPAADDAFALPQSSRGTGILLTEGECEFEEPAQAFQPLRSGVLAC